MSGFEFTPSTAYDMDFDMHDSAGENQKDAVNRGLVYYKSNTCKKHRYRGIRYTKDERCFYCNRAKGIRSRIANKPIDNKKSEKLESAIEDMELRNSLKEVWEL